MAKNNPVNLTVQTIYIFIPFLSLLALYRVEKLRLGIMISVLFSLGIWGIDSYFGGEDAVDAFIENGDNLEYVLISIVYFAIQLGVFVYLIRKWSRQWNEKLPIDNV